MKGFFQFALLCFLTLVPFCKRAKAQSSIKLDSIYRAVIRRDDGEVVNFNIELKRSKGKLFLNIRNAEERIRVDDVVIKKDSIFFQMPVFESQFRARILPNGDWRGAWVRGTAVTTRQEISFFAFAGQNYRYNLNPPSANRNVSGRWSVVFKEDKITRPAIAELHQQGTTLRGTILNPSGDYRFLEGIVSGDSLYMSVFDGSHAYSFAAAIKSDSTIDGEYYAGSSHVESWHAQRNENATLPEDIMAMYVRPGEDHLDFSFPDLDGKKVSINDSRFKGKVVVVQIMGSWCPNCMDETAFLSDYYLQHKDSVEIVALAYEYSSDFARSQKSLSKFRDRFHVTYPMLITGVTTSDTLRTEKTLPQLTPIKGFPTTIFIGKDGKVKKIDGGFYGPGTGTHFEESKNEFYETVNKLLKE